MNRHDSILAAFVAALVLVPSPAFPQAQGPTWVALDTQPPGTPPTVTFDSRSSSNSASFFDIFVHGFYTEPRLSPSGAPFTKITLPGSGEVNQTGAPDLPAVQLRLALPQGMTGVHLAQAMVVQSVPYTPPSPCWPRTIPEIDDPNGTLEVFVQDPAIYTLRTPWPAMDGDAGMPATAKLGSILGAQVKVYPFHYTPATNQLQVTTHLRVEYDHDGNAVVAPQITRRRVHQASALFDNWATVAPSYPGNPIHYNGYYLIICQNGWKPDLQPLIDQKSKRGFWVSIDYVPATGNTCDGIRGLIQTWYNATPPEADHYCLLVGEPDVIPFCSAPVTGNPPTDDLYASMDGDDLDPEVYVGRLSVSGAGQVDNEVKKIVDYMDHPPITSAFTRALLVAHLQDAPGKYEGAMESVRLASYSHPPSFVRIYGSDPLVSNSNVTNEITAGAGLVAYRGHGSSDGWAAWNGFGEWYSTIDVSGLLNTVTPVVWNIACSNHDLTWNESLGEWWLLRFDHGAVSSYGATVPSNTDENHELVRQLFKAVYDLGLTTQSHAIQYAEAQMSAIVRPYNAWLYCLLGDPEMPIRRDPPPPPWIVYAPAAVTPCVGPNCAVPVSILTPDGQPVPNLEVSLWKPPSPNAPGAKPAGAGRSSVQAAGDEVFDNRYTDATGNASVPAAPQTPGMMYLTLQDDFGDTQLDSIPVVSPSGVGSGSPPAFRFSAAPTVIRGSGRFEFGRPLEAAGRITILDATGRRVRTIEVASGEPAVAWRADDDAGRTLGPGLYFARFAGASGTASTRVVVLR